MLTSIKFWFFQSFASTYKKRNKEFVQAKLSYCGLILTSSQFLQLSRLKNTSHFKSGQNGLLNNHLASLSKNRLCFNQEKNGDNYVCLTATC